MPDNLDVTSLLVEAYEKANAVDKAQELLDQLLAAQPDNPVANIVLARTELRAGHYEHAAGFLEILLASGKLGQVNTMNAEFLLGKAYDRSGAYRKAYGQLKAENDTAYRLYGKTFNGSLVLDKIYRYKAAINRETVRTWTYPPADSIADPVFLIGFPRSGTTLIEQILASHPDITTSDERQLVQETCDRFVRNNGSRTGFPYALHDLSPDDIRELRNFYTARASALVNITPGTRVFIDKLPLNILEIGLIKRIFPGSRFILMLRDPRDVCLSCFMQSFIPNHAMINFTSMENTARFYTATMDLWLHYKDVFEPDVHTLKYESLVEDTDNNVAGLLDFLSLDWREGIVDHSSRALRTVSSPSYQDIGTPVYSRSVCRWRHYREELTVINEAVSPYLRIFGYRYR